jgi:hypothetical protein
LLRRWWCGSSSGRGSSGRGSRLLIFFLLLLTSTSSSSSTSTSLPLALGYYGTAETLEFTTTSTSALGLSCVLGVGMSYFAFLARR